MADTYQLAEYSKLPYVRGPCIVVRHCSECLSNTEGKFLQSLLSNSLVVHRRLGCKRGKVSWENGSFKAPSDVASTCHGNYARFIRNYNSTTMDPQQNPLDRVLQTYKMSKLALLINHQHITAQGQNRRTERQKKIARASQFAGAVRSDYLLSTEPLY